MSEGSKTVTIERNERTPASILSRGTQTGYRWLNCAAEFFSSARKSSTTDIWWVIGIAAVLGGLYGVFVHPFWAAEAVEFGQAWAGLVKYEKSSWGEIMFADPSLQITVPALLLLAGIDFWILSVIATAFFCATSFSAVAAASFAFNRNIALSIATPLLLLSYSFVNSHGYTVLYPVATSQFGQTGLYLTVLGLSLLACGWPIAAGVVGGVLGGAHAVWCACFVVSAFPITAWLQSKSLTRLLTSFVLALLAALALLHYGNSMMPTKGQYQPPPVPQEERIKDFSSDRIRATSHNVLLADAPTPIWAAGTFFLPSIFFVLLSFSFYFANQNAISSNNLSFMYAKRLMAIVALPVVLIFLFKIVEELDPHFYSLSVLHKRLPDLVLRAIFNRWLNLTTLLIPIMTVSLLAILVRDKLSRVGAIGLIALLGYATLRPYWWIVPVQEANNVLLLPKAFSSAFTVADIPWLGKAIFLSVIFGCLMVEAKNEKNNGGRFGKYLSMFVTASLVACVIFKLVQLTHTGYLNAFFKHRFSSADVYDALAAKAKVDNGPIIISSGVLGAFYPQLRTGRPMIVPSILKVYDKASHTRIDVFCNADPMLPLPEFYDKIKPCFENRPPWEWDVIERETSATGLITPDSWKLKINPTISGGGLTYYRITSN
ncbi:MAG: hypothetical protein JWR21_3758 [Herminiimonas sp.]|nr:hypothetical protein [Herminiimonas sp.]